MQEAIQLLGALITLAGSVFLLLGGLGVLRMPDSYNRLQAGTKASTLGTILALVGIGLFHPQWFGKLLILAFFVMLTSPISAHALARAAHASKVPLSDKTVVDKLGEKETP
ncbi:MAG: monovalent cation/H(+) antiporter subunit G [Candidatus Thiosymbion ectosymbiont of Robbea hypermnestra]|nr:monovalent cation/H(+) antiporter subunit G [Candidatus Thiosymbion ectosymbiont of Robbea hypermnestra]